MQNISTVFVITDERDNDDVRVIGVGTTVEMAVSVAEKHRCILKDRFIARGHILKEWFDSDFNDSVFITEFPIDESCSAISQTTLQRWYKKQSISNEN